MWKKQKTCPDIMMMVIVGIVSIVLWYPTICLGTIIYSDVKTLTTRSIVEKIVSSTGFLQHIRP